MGTINDSLEPPICPLVVVENQGFEREGHLHHIRYRQRRGKNGLIRGSIHAVRRLCTAVDGSELLPGPMHGCQTGAGIAHYGCKEMT